MINQYLRTMRNSLVELPQEEGIIYMSNHPWFSQIADIQLTWVNSDMVVRYEDLIENDVENLSHLFLNQLKLPIDTDSLARAIIRNRFENKTQGRQPGEEDVSDHYRKGIAGDWKNYFTDRIRDEFKEKYGPVLIDTGYENDLDW